MKGITHFTFGLSLSSFFPDLVRSAAEKGTIDLVWGGIGGYLPDFLDFKIYRFLEKWDYEFEPDPEGKNPDEILDFFENALKKAWEEKREIRVKLHTLLIGPDLWRRYGLVLDEENGKIIAFYGPSVNTSQIPVPLNQAPRRETERKIDIPFQYNYREIIVDIFSGPSLAFIPEENKVKIIFIPWHREWTHGVFSALFFSFLLGTFLYLIKSPFYIQNSIIFFIGYMSHGFLDQLGYMGVNFFYPITKKRIPGFGIAESMNPLTNFTTIWFSASLIVFNIMRYTPSPAFNINPYIFFLITGIFIPLTLILLSKLYRETKKIKLIEEEEEENPFKNF
ncbi:MAG: metal-dependent hydrolase [Candidatus Hydrothermales bacterium]